MSITSELDQAEAQRDDLIAGIRHMLYNTVAGNGLNGTIPTEDGKNTAETVQAAITALMTFVEKQRSEQEAWRKIEKQRDELRTEKNTVRKFFSVEA